MIPPMSTNPSPDVIAEIAAERRRQIDVEGWTPEHDDEHVDGQMAHAAAAYAERSAIPHPSPPYWWPWDKKWWNPEGRRRMLVKAAALIVAEIERLDRAALQSGKAGT